MFIDRNDYCEWARDILRKVMIFSKVRETLFTYFLWGFWVKLVDFRRNTTRTRWLREQKKQKLATFHRKQVELCQVYNNLVKRITQLERSVIITKLVSTSKANSMLNKVNSFSKRIWYRNNKTIDQASSAAKCWWSTFSQTYYALWEPREFLPHSFTFFHFYSLCFGSPPTRVGTRCHFRIYELSSSLLLPSFLVVSLFSVGWELLKAKLRKACMSTFVCEDIWCPCGESILCVCFVLWCINLAAGIEFD